MGGELNSDTALRAYNFQPLSPAVKFAPSGKSCALSIDKETVFADLSVLFRSGSEAWGHKVPGHAALSLTTISYLPISLVNMYNQSKKQAHNETIGDTRGAQLARAEVVDSGFLAAGTATMVPLCGMSLAETATESVKTAGFLLAHHVLTIISTAFSAVSCAISSLRHGFNIFSWVKGRVWRAELSTSKDPAGDVAKKMLQKVWGRCAEMQVDDYKKLAYEAGKKWMQKVGSTAPDFETFLQGSPGAIDELIGPFPLPLTLEGQIIRFGKFMAVQNSYEAFMAKCSRRLGGKITKALKTDDEKKVQKAFQNSYKEVGSMTFQCALAIVGFAVLIAAEVLSGGVAVHVAYGLEAVGAFIMVCTQAPHELKEQWANETFRKRDKPVIYTTLFLSIVSLISLIVLSIVSGGGVFYIMGLILAIAWVIMNLRAAWQLRQYALKIKS